MYLRRNCRFRYVLHTLIHDPKPITTDPMTMYLRWRRSWYDLGRSMYAHAGQLTLWVRYNRRYLSRPYEYRRRSLPIPSSCPSILWIQNTVPCIWIPSSCPSILWIQNTVPCIWIPSSCPSILWIQNTVPCIWIPSSCPSILYGSRIRCPAFGSYSKPACHCRATDCPRTTIPMEGRRQLNWSHCRQNRSNRSSAEQIQISHC